MDGKKSRSRRVKVLRFTNKHQFVNIETETNQELETLSRAGYNVINIQSTVVSTTTPTYVLVIITYEGEFFC